MDDPIDNPQSAIRNQGQGTALASCQRIAIVRLSALGDVVNTLPALTALRRALPHAHIAWVVETAAAGVLAGHPMLDDVMVVDRKGWSASLRRLRGVKAAAGEMGSVFRRLRQGKFDAAIDFQGNFRSGVVTFLTRASVRAGLGRSDGKELNHIFTNHHVPMPHGPLHRVERGLRLLDGLGIDTANAAPVVPASDADRERVDAVLGEMGLTPGQFAIIHAGTSAFGRYKQWPNARWAAVAARLHTELGLPVVLTRGPGASEAEEAEAIAHDSPARVAPVLSLTALGELFRRSRLFLSPDTGPMHLASAAGAPVVALFGPKDPKLYGPYFGPRAIVEKDMPCRPCRKRSCPDPQCMLTITPDEVLAAARQLLADTSAT